MIALIIEVLWDLTILGTATIVMSGLIEVSDNFRKS
jgi:hypothetical protein